MATTRFVRDAPKSELEAYLLARERNRFPVISDADPAVYINDMVIDLIKAWITEFNDSALGNWWITSQGDALSELAQNYGLERLPNETDADLKRRIRDVFRSPTPGESEYDHRLVRDYNSTIADVARDLDQTDSNPPFNVAVYIANSDGEWPNDVDHNAILAGLNTYLDDADVTPIFLDYTAAGATVREYTVNVVGTYRQDTTDPTRVVRERINAEILRLRKLNTSVTPALIIAAASVFLPDDDFFTVKMAATLVPTAPATLTGTILAKEPNIVYHGTLGTLTLTEEA